MSVIKRPARLRLRLRLRSEKAKTALPFKAVDKPRKGGREHIGRVKDDQIAIWNGFYGGFRAALGRQSARVNEPCPREAGPQTDAPQAVLNTKAAPFRQ